MPDIVSDDPIAADAWARLVAVMAPGTFTAADEALLTIYATGVALMYRAQAELTAGPLGGARGGKSPALLVLRQATAQVAQATDRLGLNRQERQRLAAPKGGGGDPRNSKFGDLIGRTPKQFE
jgi:phage terminase small subunit